MARGPLQGVRLVDLGRGEAAMLAATLLVDLGADGVRVEACGGMRAVDAVLERGRRGCPDAAPDQVRRWLARADVVVDDGALADRGIDLTALRADNPGLVVVRCPHEAGDPSTPPSGPVAGAAAGVYAPPLALSPRWSPLPAVETLAGLTAACGAVAALLARERDGRGQLVTAPLTDAAYGAVELLLAMSDRAPSAWQGIRWAGSPFVGPYRCSDGRWVFVHLGLPAHVDRLLEVLASDGMIRTVTTLKRAMGEQTRRDPSCVGSPSEARRIRSLLVELFEARPAEAWEALLGSGGLCCARVRTGPEWKREPQARESGHVVAVDDPHLGPMDQPGPWVRWEGAEVEVRRSETPRWRARATSVKPADDRAALAGVRILDCTQVIAGPVAGRALAELGAEVIRLERPDFDPAWAESFHVLFSPGKRSATVRLDPDAARAVLEALQPDVVLTNFRPGVDARLGLDPDAVRAVCPEALVVRLSAFGEQGPRAAWPGWEQTAQAMCGMQADYGGSKPELVPLPMNDECTGLAGALGALASLFARAHNRPIPLVHSSLAASATWLQRGWLFENLGRVARRERGASRGAAPLRRFAPVKDGWVWLEGTTEGLGAVAGLDGVDLLDEGAVDAVLKQEHGDAWEARAAGVDGVRIGRWLTLGQAAAAPGAPLHRTEQRGLGPVTRVDWGLHLDRTPVRRPDPAVQRGADGLALLADAAVEVLPADAVRHRDLGTRAVRRARWLVSTVRWGAYVLGTRLAPALLAVAMACGGGGLEPVVPTDAPFQVLGDSSVQGSGGTDGGLGLSASATRIQDLTVDRDGEDRLRVSWRADNGIRIRTFDGQDTWSDRVVPYKGQGRQRARPFEIGLGPSGPVTIGVDLPDVEVIPGADLRAELGGTTQLWTGFVEGTWTWDPKGRLVWALFAGPRVQVRRWDGAQWQSLGDDTPPKGYRAGNRQGPSLAFDPEGEPILAWREPYAVLPEKGGVDRFKSTRWRTRVRHWDGRDWVELAGEDSPLDEDPRDRYPQAQPGAERNLRAEWEAAQESPPRVVVDDTGSPVVAWDTLDGIQVWRWADGSWSRLPEPVDLPGDAEAIDLMGGDSGLWLAWSHQWQGKRKRFPRQIQVRRWKDGAWSAPGGVKQEGLSRPLGPSLRPELGWHEGQPVVAWVDITSGAPEVLLARFDGESWVGLPPGSREGGLGSPDRMSSTPAVVVAPGGPTVAWVEELGTGIPPGKAVVRTAQWSGGAWQRAEDLELAARPFQLRLESGAAGVYALWDQRAGAEDKGLFVGKLGDEGWRPVGPKVGLVKEARGAYDADLALDRTGQPWAAWVHNGRSAQVRQFDGTRWTVVGELPGQSVVGYAPDLEIGADGRPWLLWFGASANRDVDLKVAWFDGQDWQQVGDSWWLGCETNVGTGAPVEAALALDAESRPVVAWVTKGLGGAKKKAEGPPGQPPALHVCRWEGRAWQPLPSPAEGRKIRVPDSRRSHLALTAADGPVVSWSEDGDGARQIHASRWSGERWVPLGDRGGAVSACDGACWSPSLAVGAGARCLAWEAMADRGRNVSLRCQLTGE